MDRRKDNSFLKAGEGEKGELIKGWGDRSYEDGGKGERLDGRRRRQETGRRRKTEVMRGG